MQFTLELVIQKLYIYVFMFVVSLRIRQDKTRDITSVEMKPAGRRNQVVKRKKTQTCTLGNFVKMSLGNIADALF